MKTTMIAMTLSLVSLFSAVAMGAEPAKGTMRPVAVCNDGKTWSNDSGEHRGVCSGHKGVKEWKDGSPVHSHVKHSKVE